MAKDKRDLLDVLKAELAFLEKGGYQVTARVPWRPQFLFQDSPTCLNCDPSEPQRPCSDCVLVRLLPEKLREKKIACRYIPLNEHGETIDSFYRSATQEELEASFSRWLRTTITRLEQEKAESLRACEHPKVHVRATFAARH
jgi:hypothetical protein